MPVILAPRPKVTDWAVATREQHGKRYLGGSLLGTGHDRQ
jgi:hypothetical protein